MMVLIVCFHFQNKTSVNGVQDMCQTVINREVLIKFAGREFFLTCVSNPHINPVPKSNSFIAVPAIGAQEAIFNV